jgi:hypothetical protein
MMLMMFSPLIFSYIKTSLPSLKAAWIDLKLSCPQGLSVPGAVQKEVNFYAHDFSKYIFYYMVKRPFGSTMWIDLKLSYPQGLSVLRGILKGDYFYFFMVFLPLIIHYIETPPFVKDCVDRSKAELPVGPLKLGSGPKGGEL